MSDTAFGSVKVMLPFASFIGEPTMSATFTRHADTRPFTTFRGERQTARILCHVRWGDADTPCWEHCMILGDFREMADRDIASLAGILLGDHEDPYCWNRSYIMRRTAKYTLIHNEWGLSI